MQPCNCQVHWNCILITGLYLWLNTHYMHYEDILDAVKLGSAIEVKNCLILCVLSPARVQQQEKSPLGLSTLPHFFTNIDCSPLPTLKYSAHTFPSSAFSMVFVLPHNSQYKLLALSHYVDKVAVFLINMCCQCGFCNTF